MVQKFITMIQLLGVVLYSMAELFVLDQAIREVSLCEPHPEL